MDWLSFRCNALAAKFRSELGLEPQATMAIQATAITGPIATTDTRMGHTIGTAVIGTIITATTGIINITMDTKLA